MKLVYIRNSKFLGFQPREFDPLHRHQQGYSQAVRQRVLIPPCASPNLATPANLLITGRQFSWLERLPVTQEVVGSIPIRPATGVQFRDRTTDSKSVYGGLIPSTPANFHRGFAKWLRLQTLTLLTSGSNPLASANLLAVDRWLSGLRQLSTKESYTNTVP